MDLNKRFFQAVFLMLFVTVVSIEGQNQVYMEYIDKYSQLAVRQQKEYGIPASITLAQGLLESSAGQSDFAKKSNNHFGIKCKDWAGDRIYHDDDEKGECFRKYDQVLQSYEDHSLFLKNRSRYTSLFSLDPTDYEGWAFGLKKAGYATDPSYAYKLISIIENYNLHEFDLPSDGRDGEMLANKPKENNESLADKVSMGVVSVKTTHAIYRVNGVKFVLAQHGDTYGVIAEEFDETVGDILSYNDLVADNGLKVGARVFIGRKKKRAPEECVSHRVAVGESMYSISQDYGVRVAKLYDLNEMSYDEGAKVGMELKLR